MDRDIAISLVDVLGDIKDVLDDILAVLTPAPDPSDANAET